MEPHLPYNLQSKSKSFLVAAKGSKNVLEPLANGTPVTLRMNLPAASTGRVKKVVSSTPPLVVITPGSLLGADRDVFLVSVIGKGAVFIAPARSESTAGLVLAGIPARHSRLLVRELRSLIWSPSWQQ